ncbi:NAD(P)-dependent oxidoreductase [Arthrobacter sp. ISL-95]|uniref:NAD(P)-dependent oxidoreductase n=1 Tax=Arthrobacter sp. ISL-95 TaxID=2819116 RepID=UPI001BE680DB|nr:NAD(P)-dependent oxidoreductase [Arthrobacter sp. ISL-95]MBT2585593.1 NAD(P)-dependent oxidoreductase [Arthrobacter sp. ISL-95]
MNIRVGWVGLGDQGAPMARAIAEAGFELNVWVRRESSLTALDGLPYVRHKTLAALGAASNIVGLCLREDSDIEEILTSGGLLKSLARGTVLINHGTGLPDYAQSITLRAASAGVLVLDAPVSGGRPGAEARRLTTIVGGPREALETARPVLETFSQKIAYMGPAGCGQNGKLINNALLMMNQKNVQDILALGRNLSLDLGALSELLLSGTGRSFALEALSGAVTVNNAEHLKVLQIIDMEIFADAMKGLGQDVTTIDDYARAGADGLPYAAQLMAVSTKQS